MGRKKRDRRSSSSEAESDSPKGGSSPSSGEAREEALPKARKKQVDREDRGRVRDSNEDRRIERSRWESPDGRKRRHSPGERGQTTENQQKRRGHRDRGQELNENRTKWERNERETDKGDQERRHKPKEANRPIKIERRDSPGREMHRDNNRGHRNENSRENRSDNRRQDRRSPRRDERSNRGRNDRGRRGGRGNRFGGDGPRSRFDGSRAKNEPSPEWGRAEAKDENKPVEKEKPNFEPSGKLTEDANTVNGVVIKYTEPLEARKPKRRWRLYPFKGEKALPTLYVHRQSAFLMGRDRKVADIPLDHPSCSKQHAALQFRLVSFEREDGQEGKRVRPYLIDLESANGTFVNDVKLEPKRYHELLERDVLKFGFSSREYVILHEQSKDDALDDDVPFPPTSQK